MESPPRTVWKNAFILNFDDCRARAVLGGLYVAQRTTNNTMYCIVDTLCNISAAFVLLYDNGILVPKDQTQAIAENYNILALGTSLSFLSASQPLTQNRIYRGYERRTSRANHCPSPRYPYCFVCCFGPFARYTMPSNREACNC